MMGSSSSFNPYVRLERIDVNLLLGKKPLKNEDSNELQTISAPQKMTLRKRKKRCHNTHQAKKQKTSFSSCPGTPKDEPDDMKICLRSMVTKNPKKEMPKKDKEAGCLVIFKGITKSFLQEGPCYKVAPYLAMCRECHTKKRRKQRNMLCRFHTFRRLMFQNGKLAVAGFPDPKEASKEDLKLWLPNDAPFDLNSALSKYLLAQVGDQFCKLLQQEKEAISLHMSNDKTIAWKKVIEGVRELCDVCQTTVFNFHWVCRDCGFFICIDCYTRGRNSKNRYILSRLQCSNHRAHYQEDLMLTQIIAGDSLDVLGQKLHSVRQSWGQQCQCECKGTFKRSSEELKLAKRGMTCNGIEKENKSILSCLQDVKLSEDKETTEIKEKNVFTCDDSDYSMSKELSIPPSGERTPKSQLEMIDQLISKFIEHQLSKEGSKLKHFVCEFKQVGGSNGNLVDPTLHVRMFTVIERKSLPNVPHMWLCGGSILRLLDSSNPGNYATFQDQWKRGKPVMISDVTKHLNPSLWSPESFSKDFGETKNDLINCITGTMVPKQFTKKFWDGFKCIAERIKDKKNNPMILKIKDWPPSNSFAKVLPSRFKDFLNALPMPDYSQDTGRFNLVRSLPDCFVPPDLGPKMYAAYGSASHPTAGTTNLHLDISDAVNVLVYVGTPSDTDEQQNLKEVYQAIVEGGCDFLRRPRIEGKNQLPGALWHIYEAKDLKKIRDFLNKVSLERGHKRVPNSDPIHDQIWYLDADLRERLYKEYQVEGYAIVQYIGDAVFIPAGAPHQVRNLHDCIKVAKDFVSPENISHCFRLTQEFRDLSKIHTNHEDILQIKNIIYHAVKDSLSVF